MKLEELKLNNIYKVKLLEDDDTWYISFREYTEGRILTNGSVCIDNNGEVDYINSSKGTLCYDDNIECIYETTEEERELYLNNIS